MKSTERENEESPATKKPDNEAVSPAPNKRDGDTAKKSDEGSENEENKKEEPQMSKYEMDRMFLSKEAREIKEKLLGFTNEIIIRQNGLDPIANFESFITETTARKVLKELLKEYTEKTDELKKGH